MKKLFVLPCDCYIHWTKTAVRPLVITSTQIKKLLFLFCRCECYTHWNKTAVRPLDIKQLFNHVPVISTVINYSCSSLWLLLPLKLKKLFFHVTVTPLDINLFCYIYLLFFPCDCIGYLVCGWYFIGDKQPVITQDCTTYPSMHWGEFIVCVTL